MVKYIHWEEGKGLEEHQAKIFNEAARTTGPGVVTAKQIIERNKTEKPVFCY